jgi:CheY-like chemotaxis protein/anti-sigma regulatory factor (Ser/Thr protein kinase)
LPSAGGWREGDATRVRQVLHALVGNAVKFTETGSVMATISGGGDQLVFEISDTGPGMSPQRLGGLFGHFDQNDASATRRYGGSGLGLGIARGLARLMDGDVTAESEPGRGSIFTARMTLPAAKPSLPAQADAPKPPPGPRRIQDRLRVLAAEDNPTNQLVLRTLLEQVGVTVHLVGDGEEAIDAWRTAHWDVVLMDIRMPGVDGVAATRAIRALEAAEQRPRTPIVAVTADTEQQAEYLAAGMDGLVAKPIQLAQLIGAIEAALAAEPGERADEATFAA